MRVPSGTTIGGGAGAGAGGLAPWLAAFWVSVAAGVPLLPDVVGWSDFWHPVKTKQKQAEASADAVMERVIVTSRRSLGILLLARTRPSIPIQFRTHHNITWVALAPVLF